MLARGSSYGREGFTLLEVLAALAIASLIIVSSAALTWNVAFYFDRGTRSVTDGEQLILVSERLASDFAAARFLIRSTEAGPVSIFTGAPAKMVFVTGGGAAAGQQGEEIVALSAEQGGSGIARLVRRRVAWRGPRTPIEKEVLGDEVVLIEGKLGIGFTYGRSNNEQTITWSDSWTREFTLPRFVRVTLREIATGVDLLGGATFVIRSDAPPACAKADAKAECLLVSAGQTTPRGNPQ